MIEPLLQSQLEPVVNRQRQWRLGCALLRCWSVAALAGLLLLGLHRGGVGGAWVLPLFVLGTVAATVVAWRRTFRWAPDYRELARRIERQHPELHALLLTAVEQRPDPATGRLNFLQQRVIQEALVESTRHSWIESIPARRVLAVEFAQVAALALVVFLALQLRAPASRSAPGLFAGLGGGAGSVTVTPGDVELERGSGLVVLAKFPGTVPTDATLVIGPGAGALRRVPMARSLADPVFGGSMPEVTTNLVYRVDYGTERTRDFTVKVFEHPALVRSDARVRFPDYTGLAEKRIDETRRVSAVEGSRLSLSLALNKPVVSARLVGRDKSIVPVVVGTNTPAATLEDFALRSSQTYDLQLVDADGRTNKLPAQFVFEALQNRPPDIKVTSPRGDQRVSALEEITFSGEAWDDFGLRGYGLAYTLAGKPPQHVTLGTNAPAQEKRPLNHLLRLEDLGVLPDQLVSWFAWAEDLGPDGKLRRTETDMYFAEVRPFDEIFREGQAGESEGEQAGEGGAGNAALKLAELQKQIINATWKLRRQAAAALPQPATLQYKKDAGVVRDSQEQALEQVRELAEQANNPRAEAQLGNVEREMEKALDHLEKAAETPDRLQDALAAEQSAYQGLLQLASREYQVSRSRSRQGQAGGQQRMQSQLENLDLKQREDRYETQRQAAPQQNAAQREQLQVVNRLKELAQRQQDLNERIKELQSALQEAKTEEEREEMRRRLKRLREEQSEMLADVDELRQRMDRSQDQPGVTEARQQLEQTRGELQQAAEALEREAASQALAAGTRAQRDLQQLRDELRKRSSSQFAEDMREMRQDARQLAQDQEEIRRQMDAAEDQKLKRLTDSGEAQKLSAQFDQQRAGLTNLFEQMRRTTEQAETVEPLLSRQLYDVLREQSQSGTDDALRLSSELLKRGFSDEAGQFEQRARQDLDQLKSKVERAAESVLGDDTESLRLARRELDALAQQLQEEVANALARAGRGTNTAASGASGANTNRASRASSGASGQTNRLASSANAGGTNGQQQASQSANRSEAGSPGQPQDQPPGRQGEQAGGRQPGQSAGEQPGQPGGTGGDGQQSPATAQGQQPSSSPSQQGQQGSGTNPGQGNAEQDPASAPGRGNARSRGGQRTLTGARDGSETAQEGRTQPGRNVFDPNSDSAATEGGGGGGPHGPLTGERYIDWSDRLRDVEEMLDTPELRMEAARIRDRARAVRAEFKRHSRDPRWDLVRMEISGPLVELRDRVAEELARRESSDALVPIDRDPVPRKFSDLVRRYYEKLGSEQP